MLVAGFPGDTRPWLKRRTWHGLRVLELLTTLLLIGLALWLGPFIKRFGRAYAADVFHDNPLTGKSYIILTDIVYYLIFTAYILFTVRFERTSGWPIEAEQLSCSTRRPGSAAFC